MLVCKLPSVRQHWRNNVMSTNRFEETKRLIHFNGNSKLPEKEISDYDKLFKIRPLCSQI